MAADPAARAQWNRHRRGDPMTRFNRRTTPKVTDGRVQKKNRHAPTPTYWNTHPRVPVIDKERPGRGYRHLLRKNDVVEVIGMIPDWDELAIGLDAVLLAKAEFDCDGWHHRGVIGICAWERDLWRDVSHWFYEDHEELLSRLGVECEPRDDGVLCKFTEETARAYQLLHVFLHELGHHRDRMTTNHKLSSGRGEGYAEEFAFEYGSVVWERYLRAFDMG